MSTLCVDRAHPSSMYRIQFSHRHSPTPFHHPKQPCAWVDPSIDNSLDRQKRTSKAKTLSFAEETISSDNTGSGLALMVDVGKRMIVDETKEMVRADSRFLSAPPFNPAQSSLVLPTDASHLKAFVCDGEAGINISPAHDASRLRGFHLQLATTAAQRSSRGASHAQSYSPAPDARPANVEPIR